MSISFSPDTSKGLGEIRLSCVYERAGEGSPPGGDKADLHYPKELGILHVNVVEARGLPKMDRFSHTDSFAKVQFKDEVGETFVAMDTEDPGWNQEFRFHVHKRNDLRGVMQCSVWDKDDSLRDQSDDVIGQCELELHEELLLGREDDVWMQLKAAPGSPKSVRPVTSTTQQRALTELSLSLSLSLSNPPWVNRQRRQMGYLPHATHAVCAFRAACTDLILCRSARWARCE